MPYYIILGKWTEQGVKNAKDSPKRVAVAKALVEKGGAKWHGIYYTFGEYDFVALTEGTSDENAMQTLLTLGGQGNMRTTTLKAFSQSEAEKIFEKLP